MADLTKTEQFANDVETGLSNRQKSIPSVYFYDRRGSELFEDICDLTEYYPTRTEASILKEFAPQIASGLTDKIQLIELGSGSSVKTRLLLEAFMGKNGQTVYKPIDISESILKKSARELEQQYVHLQVQPVVGRYSEGLYQTVSKNGLFNLIIWLGSSIGNFERDEAVEFLKDIRQAVSKNSVFLVGIDLRKDTEVLYRAYNDAAGVTAQFNLNLLKRINRELQADFKLSQFKHQAVYDSNAGCIKMYLTSKALQTVKIEGIGKSFIFERGERIHTENSYKYSQEEIERLAKEAGLSIKNQWFDPKHWFSLNLFSV